MSSMGMQEPSTSQGRPRRWSIRKRPLPINPVILASGGSDTVMVMMVDYVARRVDYDTEECIQKALEDDEVELYHLSRHGDRRYDTYRLTAKGRRTSDRHIREVFRKSREVAREIARRVYEEDTRESAGHGSGPASQAEKTAVAG